MKSIKRVVGGVIVLGVAVLVLALTCPDEDGFDRWAKRASEPESGSVFEKAKGKALSTQAKWTADYEDHVLWATVDAYQGGTEYRFIGIFGTWIKLGEEGSGE